MKIFKMLRPPSVLKTMIARIHEVGGELVMTGEIKGLDYLRSPRLNKGTGFTLKERQTLGFHGLLPPRVKTQQEQMELLRIALGDLKNDLAKYTFLMDLHDRNEKLFFKLITEDIEKMLPIVYTPTVGLACQKFGLIYRRPRGLFITYHDRGHIFELMKNWPEPIVKAICVTDGERILGLGDLGASGMGISVGKLTLYTALAGVKPHLCLPITIDVGTNNEKLLNDPYYIGLKQKRIRGDQYYELLDEFMEAAVKRYGRETLIQFEDFGIINAFDILDRYKDRYCTFNDDIQGTAATVVAGLYAAERLVHKKMTDHCFVFFGAGGAAIGIANLIVTAMIEQGSTAEQAREKIWMFDQNGLLTKERLDANVNNPQNPYMRDSEPSKSLIDVIEKAKPSVLIGCSTVGGGFTPEILKVMAANNEKPIIMALSNPTSKAECTAQQAYDNTEGRCIFASGSPFPPVEYSGKTFYPGQGNNAYIFPGVALGIIASGLHHVKNEVFLVAAKAVADLITEEDLSRGSLYPPLSHIQTCSKEIAVRVMEYAYEKGQASTYPEPQDKYCYIRSHQYNCDYQNALREHWDYPNEDCPVAILEPKKKYNHKPPCPCF
ncbi:NADP-dependent malic enzyme-like [Uranotaenia lowii]|uniref:NADP-dependent malic enzyme-like n=1 Tax=Uranotaenia lowii TaxID=190385 RepID=UPI00247A9BA2|nr:NADP-dependent malic enzyme-like [Uranotaenia lowii]